MHFRQWYMKHEPVIWVMTFFVAVLVKVFRLI